MKRPGWALEDRAREVQLDHARALAAAVERYAQALGYERENAGVRGGLAALYWARAERCEQERDEAGQVYYETLVQEYDNGAFAARLRADAVLSVDTYPQGADVVAYRYFERDRVLRAERPRGLGTTPIREVRLAPGSWLLVLRREGYRDVRYSVLARRGEHQRARVNLYTEEQIGSGMIYVPGGDCVIGGDPEALDSLPGQVVAVPDFAIGRFPVTFDEYLEFIQDLEQRDAPRAQKRLPRGGMEDGVLVTRDAAGRWVPWWDLIVEGEQAREFCSQAQVGQVPVTGIDWFDAVAYCRWRSVPGLCESENQLIRLPTEFEREKAARGVDGRWFPWGDRFDPTFGKMRDSRPGLGQPEPVGGFATDESPYGVRDLAGGMREWMADVVGELSADVALAEPEPVPGTPRDQGTMRTSRGGSWSGVASWSHCASRYRLFPLARNPHTGFRVAKPLGGRD